MKTQEGNSSKDGANRTKIVVTVISGLFLIGAAWVGAHHSDRNSNLKNVPPATFGYVGLVSTDEGKPIPDATVLATRDENVGQTIRTDTNGQFQIQLPVDTRSLRLKIDAAGFGEKKIQADIHRTGPEEIYLHAIAPNTAPAAGAHKTPPRPTAQPQISVSPSAPPPSPPNQGIINNAPNQGIQNNCAPGVVNCDQSIHIEPVSPPYHLPIASYNQAPLQTESSARFSPGVVLAIWTDRVFEIPAFTIDCLSPCKLSNARMSQQKGQTVITHDFPPTSVGATRDSLHYKIAFSDPLSPKETILLDVRALGPEIPKVTSVVSVQSPDQ